MRYTFLQFAKGYAIFTIMLFHAMQRLVLPEMAQKAIVLGGTGVHLFFLLSGFGLALSKRGTDAGSFYRRRLTKIWIPYVLALSLSWLLAWSLQLFPDGYQAWLSGVLGYQMFIPAYMESFGGHFWFISTIIQLYLLFPILMSGYNRLRNPWLFFTICLGVSVLWWILIFALDKGSVRTWNSCCFQFLWEFALGIVLAKQLPQLETQPMIRQFWQAKQWPLWILGGMGGIVIMVLLVLKTGRFGPVFNDIPALFGYSMLCVGVYFFSQKYVPFISRFFEWTGDNSFSIYLTHVIALDLFLMALSQIGMSFHLILISVYLVVAYLFGLVFERISARVTR